MKCKYFHGMKYKHFNYFKQKKTHLYTYMCQSTVFGLVAVHLYKLKDTFQNMSAFIPVIQVLRTRILKIVACMSAC